MEHFKVPSFKQNSHLHCLFWILCPLLKSNLKSNLFKADFQLALFNRYHYLKVTNFKIVI